MHSDHSLKKLGGFFPVVYGREQNTRQSRCKLIFEWVVRIRQLLLHPGPSACYPRSALSCETTSVLFASFPQIIAHAEYCDIQGTEHPQVSRLCGVGEHEEVYVSTSARGARGARGTRGGRGCGTP